jgi:arginase family enzyme
VAEKHGPVGLIHFDTHTDTGREVFGATLSHGSCMYRLVESGHIDPERYVQIGLRGYWPGAEEFGWQRERGIVSYPMHDVRDHGIRAVTADAIEHVGAGPVFLSVDIDVLDPAFAPGTGTPEPGGMTSGELLWACRELASAVELVGHEIVEVLPDRIGSRDITALVAERVVRETLTGVAARRLATLRV